jgi:F-type H+-transporting ATPase subunit gamma
MANTLDIRRRIRSVKNTAQITKAMQMVAASKMRKAQAAALAGRPYYEALHRVLAALHGKVDPLASPLLAERPVNRVLIVLISTDKGLCGPLNTNLFRELARFDASKTVFVTVGRKGVQFLARTRRQVLADFPASEVPRFREIRPVAAFCTEKFLSGEVDQVSVLYPKFINTLNQQPTVDRLLPIPEADIATAKKVGGGEFVFEPDENSVLAAILPHYLNYDIYQMVLDARASEHSSRMVAMKNATDNAKQLVKDLTLEYNKIRQASITTELLEIATAQMAVQ